MSDEPHLGRHLARDLARGVLLPIAVWYGVLVATGYLLTHQLTSSVKGEDAVNRWFVTQRTPQGNDLSNIASHIGNTGSVIIATAVACLIIWATSKRLRSALAVAVGVAAQALVFLFTTLAVERPRPQVPKLDVSPPTSSFPSGHTGATTGLYIGLAIVCVTRFRNPAVRVLTAVVFGVMPLLVGTARLYRGMHHPTDVLFGMLNGLVCATVAYLAIGRARSDERDEMPTVRLGDRLGTRAA